MCVVHSIACMHTCSLSSSDSQTINTCSSLHSHMSTSVLVKDFKTLHSCIFSPLTLAFAAINSLITQWRGRRWSLSHSWSGFVTLALLHGSWLYTGCPVPFILSLNPYKELERGCDKVSRDVAAAGCDVMAITQSGMPGIGSILVWLARASHLIAGEWDGLASQTRSIQDRNCRIVIFIALKSWAIENE